MWKQLKWLNYKKYHTVEKYLDRCDRLEPVIYHFVSGKYFYKVFNNSLSWKKLFIKPIFSGYEDMSNWKKYFIFVLQSSTVNPTMSPSSKRSRWSKKQICTKYAILLSKLKIRLTIRMAAEQMCGFNHPMAGINPRRRSKIKPRTKRHSNIEAVNNTETKPLRAVCFVFRARLEIICTLLDLDREVL